MTGSLTIAAGAPWARTAQEPIVVFNLAGQAGALMRILS
jgi:hypothetical protein